MMKKRLLFIPIFGLVLAGCSFEDLMFWLPKDEPEEILPTSISVTPTSLDLKVSESKDLNELLSFTFEPSNVTDKNVVFSTESPYFSLTKSTITTFEYPGTGTLKVSSAKNSKVFAEVEVNVSKDEPILIKHNVTYTASSDFSINCLKEDGYLVDEIVSFTVTVNNSQKEIDYVAVDNTHLDPTNNVYSFTMPDNDVSLEIVLKDKEIIPPVTGSTNYDIVYDMGTRKTSYLFKEGEENDILACFVANNNSTNIISSVSSFTYIYGGGYGGSGETSWLTGDVLKFGTTSVNGSLTLDLSKKVYKVEITGMVSATTAEVDINGVKTTCSNMAIAGKTTVDTGAYTSFSVDINESSSLTISTTNKKVLYIKSINLFYRDGSPIITEKYTVTWNNYDGTTLKIDYDVPQGTTPVYEGVSPSKPSDDEYNYSFSGWDPIPAPITGDTTYTATFNAIPIDAKIAGSVPLVSSDNKTVEYGIYPQSYVSDETLIATLNSLTLDSNNYVLYNNEYFAKVTSNVYNNESYKFSDGTIVTNGSTYWFKCETIKWDVLSIENGKYTVISANLLDSHLFYRDYSNRNIGDITIYPNNYKESDIRQYLNNEFLSKAFMLGSDSIIDTEIDATLSDKIYLPSTQNIADLSVKTAKTTDYSRATGAFSSKDNSYLHNGSYWTKTASDNFTYCAWNVNAGGVLSEYAVDGASHSIRPCIQINVH